jgi:hypothetical protein
MADDKGDGAWFARVGDGTRNRPITWQGWLLLILYTIAVMGTVFLMAFGTLAFVVGLVSVSVLFGYLCVRKSRLSAHERLVVRD